MRIWLQKQKKKEEAKAAAQATPTPVETPAPAEVQQAGDAVDKAVESIEEAPKADGAGGEQTAEGIAGDADQRAGSAALQTTEVGLCLSASSSHSHSYGLRHYGPSMGTAPASLAKMNKIVAAHASEHGVHSTSPCTVTDPCHQDPTGTQNEASERRPSNASQSVAMSVEPSVTGVPIDEQNNASGLNGGMMGNNPMMMNGMAGQMPYGFPNQPGFNNGMYGMNGMSNMMGNSNWNGMASMGTSPPTM